VCGPGGDGGIHRWLAAAFPFPAVVDATRAVRPVERLAVVAFPLLDRAAVGAAAWRTAAVFTVDEAAGVDTVDTGTLTTGKGWEWNTEVDPLACCTPGVGTAW
jgi:hypothetical protein